MTRHFLADRRGRVPFALVGVLLLLGANAYALDLAAPDSTVDTGPAEAMDRTALDARTALASAVTATARAAARAPVTTPANSSLGRVLNDSTPFRDALRVRIALAARAALVDVRRVRGDVVVTASLSPVESLADLRTAKRGVGLAERDRDHGLIAVVRGVRIEARRDGRLLADRTVDVEVHSAVPVLAMHDRTQAYQARLNRGPLAGPGLGRDLTARLYPVAWARGWGQYRGAPIANVLANRHVGLSTNAGLLAEQERVFGTRDRDGQRALGVATARVGITDVLGPRAPAGGDWVDTVLRPTAVDDGGSGEWSPTADPGPPVVVAADAAAQGALLETLGSDRKRLWGRRSLNATLRDSYRADAALLVRARQVRDGARPPRRPPGPNWALASARTSTTTRVTATATGPEIDSADAWTGADVGATGSDDTASPAVRTRTFGSHHRRVETRSTVRRVWVRLPTTVDWTGRSTGKRGRKQNKTRRRVVRTAAWTDTHLVTVAVVGRHDPPGLAPARRTPVFERGGALGGPNLVDVPGRARASLLGGRSIDDLARRTADRGVVETRAVAEAGLIGARPPGLVAWVRADLLALHRAVRNNTVSVPRRRVAAGAANPAGRLARAIRANRSALLDAPSPDGAYDGAADRARYAVRAAYLDAVLRRLDARTEAVRDRNQEFLDTVGAGSARRLAALTALAVEDPSRGRAREAAPGGPTLSPEGVPPYLTLAAVGHSHVPAVPPGERVHPLAARNVNWFALPHGDLGKAVGALPFGTRRVPLSTAAGTLVTAETALAEAPDERLRRRRDVLENRVGLALDDAETVARRALRAETELSAQQRRRIVAAALAGWNSTGERGLAVADGRFAAAVVGHARERGVPPHRATVLDARLRRSLADALAGATLRVPAEATNRTASATTRVASSVLAQGAAGAIEGRALERYRRWTGLKARALPAGLPVAPPPWTWYATVNAWTVSVRGGYLRFTVTAPVGDPGLGGAPATYVRDGSAVRLDWDGDGRTEPLGRGERITFAVETTVVVAVPPGHPGVGDSGGDRNETSAAWPCPGAAPVAQCSD